jgi:hypothetical protein
MLTTLTTQNSQTACQSARLEHVASSVTHVQTVPRQSARVPQSARQAYAPLLQRRRGPRQAHQVGLFATVDERPGWQMCPRHGGRLPALRRRRLSGMTSRQTHWAWDNGALTLRTELHHEASPNTCTPSPPSPTMSNMQQSAPCVASGLPEAAFILVIIRLCFAARNTSSSSRESSGQYRSSSLHRTSLRTHPLQL